MVALVVVTAVLLLIGGLVLRWWTQRQIAESGALEPLRAPDPLGPTDAAVADPSDRPRWSDHTG